MSTTPADISKGEAAASFEYLEAGLHIIPEENKTTDLRGQFWIWAGANIAPINWVLGALGVVMGLGLVETVVVLVLGNVFGMALFGLFVTIGQRTGVTGMVLSRAVFGRRGAYLPAAVQVVITTGWCAVNTWLVLDLVMALFGRLGWIEPGSDDRGIRVGVAAFIMILQVAIAWFGYRVISAFERWTVPPTIVILAAMTLVAWIGLDVKWGYSGDPTLTPSQHIAAISTVTTAIGIGWGISWLGYAGDYSRFVSTSVPAWKLFMASALGQFIPVVWLGALGATLATLSSSSDPGKIIVDAYGVLAIPVLLLVVHGPLATNILNIYTCTVSTQALDIRVDRRALNVVVGVIAMVVLVAFIYNGDFASTVDAYLVAVVGWVSPWSAVMLVHWFFIARRHVDSEALLLPPGSGVLPSMRPTALFALSVGIVFTWLFMYGLIPLLQGPIATAMGGIDLSWLVGFFVAGAAYFGLEYFTGGVKPRTATAT